MTKTRQQQGHWTITVTINISFLNKKIYQNLYFCWEKKWGDKILQLFKPRLRAFMLVVARWHKSPNQRFSVKRIHFLPHALFNICSMSTMRTCSLSTLRKQMIWKYDKQANWSSAISMRYSAQMKVSFIHLALLWSNLSSNLLSDEL